MKENILLLFTLAPVLRAFISVILAGISFPLCGVMVLNLNLIPLRFMLMHGVILGGTLSICFSFPLTLTTVIINLILIFLMLFFSKNLNNGLSISSSATMVFTMALASFLIHIKKVPAKDSLGFLWGSPFLISNSDLIFLIFTVSILFIYLISNFKKIKIILFDKNIGISMGINYNLNYNFMVLLISLIVAVGLKILGAFLIDCLLILPVLISIEISKSFKAKGIKKIFVLSSLIGFISSFFGFLVSVIFDLPLGATISALTIMLLICVKIKNLMGVFLK